MNDPRCECCDLPEYSCGKKAIKQGRATEPSRQDWSSPDHEYFESMRITAKYPGRCSQCREPYGEGASITRGARGWAGPCCG